MFSLIIIIKKLSTNIRLRIITPFMLKVFCFIYKLG